MHWALSRREQVLRPVQIHCRHGEHGGGRLHLSEKLFNGILARSVPVYFGAYNVANFVNPARFVHCNVSKAKLHTLRTHQRGHKFTFDPQNERPSDATLVEWASAELGAEVAPCVARVKELDQDDDAYLRVLQDPLFLPGQYEAAFGRTLARGLLGVWQHLIQL